MKIFREDIALARSILKKNNGISAPVLMRKLNITHAAAEQLIKAVIKEVFSKKKVPNKDRKMSTYELKAHIRLAEAEMAQDLLTLIERTSRQGLGSKEQMDAIVFELQKITKKPIVPVAQIEDD